MPIANELLVERGFLYNHSLMHNDHTSHYVRAGNSWTDINYEAESAHEWMKPLVRGEETDPVELPASWHLDSLPPTMFIKSSFTSHGFVSPRDIEQLWADQPDWVVRGVDYAIFPIAIHLDVSGRLQNQLMLKRPVAHIREAEGVKFAYIKDVALDFKRRFPRR